MIRVVPAVGACVAKVQMVLQTSAAVNPAEPLEDAPVVETVLI
tara:strand:- start:220 stop:348 length:129 start_codon:yes stop_codon:yes gene_type:complete